MQWAWCLKVIGCLWKQVMEWLLSWLVLDHFTSLAHDYCRLGLSTVYLIHRDRSPNSVLMYWSLFYIPSRPIEQLVSIIVKLIGSWKALKPTSSLWLAIPRFVLQFIVYCCVCRTVIDVYLIRTRRVTQLHFTDIHSFKWLTKKLNLVQIH